MSMRMIRGYNVTIERDNTAESPSNWRPDEIRLYLNKNWWHRVSKTEFRWEHSRVFNNIFKGDVPIDWREFSLYADKWGDLTRHNSRNSPIQGRVYVNPEEIEKSGQTIEEVIDGHLKAWNMWLCQDVWKVTIHDKQGHLIDSIFEIYGRDEADAWAEEYTPEESEVMSEYEAREAIARAVKRCFDRIPKELVEELTEPMKYAGV